MVVLSTASKRRIGERQRLSGSRPKVDIDRGLRRLGSRAWSVGEPISSTMTSSECRPSSNIRRGASIAERIDYSG
jgi:hypothetical protein